jgi:hypothetical protein
MLRAVSGLTRGQVASFVAQGVRPGNTIGPDLRATAATATAMAADTLYAHPVFVPEAVPFVGVCMSIGTSVAATLGKMAIYGAAARGNIGALIEECVATVDMNAAGNAIVQTNFASPRTLAVGWYWLACKFNGLAQPHSLSGTGLMGNGGALLYGSLTLAVNVRAIGAAGTTTRAEAASTYASAFPATPTLTFQTGTPGVPIMGIVAV